MATHAKGPGKPKMPKVEFANGKAFGGGTGRKIEIGKDPMTGKNYFYRGGHNPQPKV